jgi:hypothetical protein
MRIHRSFVQRGNKAVTTTWHGLNEGGIFGRIAQSSAEFADRDIHCVVEVSKTVFRPDTGLQFLARDQVSRVLQQNLQYFEGLVLEFDAASGLADLSGGEIGFKRPKAYRPVPVIHYGSPVI